MNDPTVLHETFTIERTYKQSPARVFDAFANMEKKRRWFVEGEGWEVIDYAMDFRVGGLEGGTFRYKDGPVIKNETMYTDIIPNRRIVTAYSMVVGAKRISSSLATMQLIPVGDGTRFVYTEQGAYFDGADQPKNRLAGCQELFEKLAVELARGDK